MSGFNVDDKLVKRVGDPNDLPLTPEQADEWVKCAQDKMYFFENYVYVQGAKGKTLFKPRDYQKRAIEAMANNRFVVGLMPRQSGKCICKETKYTVRNKLTGECMDVTAEEFHERFKEDVG